MTLGAGQLAPQGLEPLRAVEGDDVEIRRQRGEPPRSRAAERDHRAAVELSAQIPCQQREVRLGGFVRP